MAPSDISSWAGVGLTALALTGGCIAYVHALQRSAEGKTDEKISLLRESIHLASRETEEKILTLKREMEDDVRTERTERSAVIDAERQERRREQDRLGATIDSFRVWAQTVTGLTEGVKYLGQTMEDHRTTTDRSLGEIKDSVRGLDLKFNSLPGASTATRRVRKMRGE